MRKTHTFGPFLGVCLLLFTVLLLSSTAEAPPPKFKFTKKVDTIVQSKCYGCHSEKGRGQKAKDKLMWDDLAGMSTEDRVKKMELIQGVVEKGAMPPKRMVERKPELKLTDKETKALKKWAKKHAKAK